MLATVDGSEDKGVLVQVVTIELPAIGQLKDTLTHLDSGTVDLIEEEDYGRLTGRLEPVWRVPRGTSVVHARQTDEVALGHLRGTSLDDRKTYGLRELIDHLGLADTVATTKKDGLTHIGYERSDLEKSLEVDSHFVFTFTWVGWWMYYT